MQRRAVHTKDSTGEDGHASPSSDDLASVLFFELADESDVKPSTVSSSLTDHPSPPPLPSPPESSTANTASERDADGVKKANALHKSPTTLPTTPLGDDSWQDLFDEFKSMLTATSPLESLSPDELDERFANVCQALLRTPCEPLSAPPVTMGSASEGETGNAKTHDVLSAEHVALLAEWWLRACMANNAPVSECAAAYTLFLEYSRCARDLPSAAPSHTVDTDARPGVSKGRPFRGKGTYYTYAYHLARWLSEHERWQQNARRRHVDVFAPSENHRSCRGGEKEEHEEEAKEEEERNRMTNAVVSVEHLLRVLLVDGPAADQTGTFTTKERKEDSFVVEADAEGTEMTRKPQELFAHRPRVLCLTLEGIRHARRLGAGRSLTSAAAATLPVLSWLCSPHRPDSATATAIPSASEGSSVQADPVWTNADAIAAASLCSLLSPSRSPPVPPNEQREGLVLYLSILTTRPSTSSTAPLFIPPSIASSSPTVRHSDEASHAFLRHSSFLRSRLWRATDGHSRDEARQAAELDDEAEEQDAAVHTEDPVSPTDAVLQLYEQLTADVPLELSVQASSLAAQQSSSPHVFSSALLTFVCRLTSDSFAHSSSVGASDDLEGIAWWRSGAHRETILRLLVTPYHLHDLPLSMTSRFTEPHRAPRAKGHSSVPQVHLASWIVHILTQELRAFHEAATSTNSAVAAARTSEGSPMHAAWQAHTRDVLQWVRQLLLHLPSHHVRVRAGHRGRRVKQSMPTHHVQQEIWLILLRAALDGHFADLNFESSSLSLSSPSMPGQRRVGRSCELQTLILPLYGPQLWRRPTVNQFIQLLDQWGEGATLRQVFTTVQRREAATQAAVMSQLLQRPSRTPSRGPPASSVTYSPILQLASCQTILKYCDGETSVTEAHTAAAIVRYMLLVLRVKSMKASMSDTADGDDDDVLGGHGDDDEYDVAYASAPFADETKRTERDGDASFGDEGVSGRADEGVERSNTVAFPEASLPSPEGEGSTGFPQNGSTEDSTMSNPTLEQQPQQWVVDSSAFGGPSSDEWLAWVKSYAIPFVSEQYRRAGVEDCDSWIEG